MIAAFRQNSLAFALVILCAAALYLVYRDMRRIEKRLDSIDAAIGAFGEREEGDFDFYNIPYHVGGMVAAEVEDVEDVEDGDDDEADADYDEDDDKADADEDAAADAEAEADEAADADEDDEAGADEAAGADTAAGAEA